MIVGIGSFLGGICRYALSHIIHVKFPAAFPYGTFTVNLIGCLLIGIVYGIVEKINLYPEWRLFLATGLLGGFTTFSAFSYETFNLMRNGQAGIAIAYILASVAAGLLFTALGFYMAKG